MDRTTTVIVALIAAAGLSMMVYAVPAQRALAWGGGFGFAGCGFGCGGPFFVHKVIIQTISQTNRCFDPSSQTPTPPTPPTGKDVAKGGSGGSGGAGGSGGEGGQGGKDIGATSTSNTDINQKANGGNSNGGHAGNANGGDARLNDDDQKSTGSDQQNQNLQAAGSDQGQNNNKVVCINTATNTAGHGRLGGSLGGIGFGDIEPESER